MFLEFCQRRKVNVCLVDTLIVCVAAIYEGYLLVGRGGGTRRSQDPCSDPGFILNTVTTGFPIPRFRDLCKSILGFWYIRFFLMSSGFFMYLIQNYTSNSLYYFLAYKIVLNHLNKLKIYTLLRNSINRSNTTYQNANRWQEICRQTVSYHELNFYAVSRCILVFPSVSE